MARRSRGCVYRKTKTRTTRNGTTKSYAVGNYRARYLDGDGKERDHTIILPNGARTTDRESANKAMDAILQRSDRESVGLIDPRLDDARTSMRVVVGRYLRHMRRKRRTRRYIKGACSFLKAIIGKADINRLADFDEDRIDRALGMVADTGASPATVNAYRKHAFALGQWALKVARITDRNPVAAVERRDESADIRKERRSLSHAEACRLLDVSGPRRLFYHTMLFTGLRVTEAASLEWRDLDLRGNRPVIRLRAETTKSKRAAELPVHPDLAAVLAEAKPPFAAPTDRVFKTVPRLRTLKGADYKVKGKPKRYRGDLDRAGIPFADDLGRTFDRHALRTTFVSWMGLYGVDERAQTALARHAPIGVTQRHYQDFTVFDLWAEIEKLPGPAVSGAAEEIRATGTDGGGRHPEGGSAVAPPVALAPVPSGPQVSSADREGHTDGTDEDSGKTTEIGVSGPKTDWAMQDLNLRLPPCKGGALAN